MGFLENLERQIVRFSAHGIRGRAVMFALVAAAAPFCVLVYVSAQADFTAKILTIIALALAMAASDSSRNSVTDFYFTEDSVFYDFSDEDTTRASYRLQPETRVLVLHAENEVDTLHYQFTKDSTMILTGNDSVSLYFRRRE